MSSFRRLATDPGTSVSARVAARRAEAEEVILTQIDALVSAAEAVDPASADGLRRAVVAAMDRLAATLTAEHCRLGQRPSSVEQRRVEHVKRLLAGEIADTTSFAYSFDGHHVGVVASGEQALPVTKALADALGCRHLAVRVDDGLVWAWLGHREAPDLGRLDRIAPASCPAGVALALGEAGRGVAGWRRTHQQAAAAFLVARRMPGNPVRYADVALLSSMVQDDLLASSLHDLYLAPLDDERGGGATLRETLRAYFAAGRNGASAAAALNVSRQTITNRLHTVEARVGRSLTDCATSIEVALRLDDFVSDEPVGIPRRWPLSSDAER